MIRIFIRPLALATAAWIATSIATGSAAWAQVAEKERLTAQLIVERVRPHLPRDFDQGSRLVGIRAEGEMVVLSVEVPPEWLGRGVAEFERFFFAGFCGSSSRVFFDNGIAVRIDTRALGTKGEHRPGTVVTACPAAGR